MKSFSTFLTIALGVWNLPLGTAAKECETSSATDPETGEKVLRLSSPDQLEVFEGCTTITGHIRLEASYSGNFILNGVTAFTGTISMDGAENLLSVEMRDLEELGNINLTSVGNMHLPRLQNAGDVLLVQASSSGEVDLGSLVETNSISLRGSWTSINVESLTTVHERAEFCSWTNCQIMSDENPPSIVVDLPALKTTNKLDISGAVESLSIPQLEVAGYPDSEFSRYPGLRLNIHGRTSTLDVDAPKLHTLTGTLDVYGEVSSLSLGALRETDLGITFIAWTPITFYSTIRTARFFYLWGSLERIYLPDMVDLGFLSLDYEPRVPCNETLYKLWQAFDTHGQKRMCPRVEIPDPDPDDSVDEDTSTDDQNNGPDDEETEDTDTNNDEDSSSASTPQTSTNSPDPDAGSGDEISKSESGNDGSNVPGENGAYRILPSVGEWGLVIVAVGLACFY